MQEATSVPFAVDEKVPEAVEGKTPEAVSTHVLVEENQVAKLRELSRRTRIAQSEYLREAVDDVLGKYGRGAKESP
ncbi:MAG: ribbon-helix-helix domain-containing protein [Myxococcaceae bacterium]